MRSLSDTEKFMQIVTEQNRYEWFREFRTSTLPNYEYDAAGVEQTTFAIHPDARTKWRL